MERKTSDRLAKKAESSEAAEITQSSLQREMSHSAQHEAKSTSPPMKTESVDIDSASISAGAPSPAPSSSSPTTHHASPPPQEVKPVSNLLQVAIKLLVSNSASGLIIGRSGSTISDLQAKSQTRIKLSQGGDYYPGTSDRVCLIQGSLPNSSVAVEMVLTKLYELQSFQQLPSAAIPAAQVRPDTNTTTEALIPEDTTNASTSFIVRLLVPSTCCGMIIGRGGSNIKSLKEKSEVTYIQLSPKEHEIMIGGSTLSTSERIMTITGSNFTSCVNCVRIILNDMGQNPEISRYINMTTSYSKNLATVAAPPSAYTVASTSGFFIEHEAFQQHVMSQSPQILESPSRYMQQIQPDPGLGLLQQHLMSHQGSPTNYDGIPHGDLSLPPLVGDPSAMIPPQPYDQNVMSSPLRNPESAAQSAQMSFPQYQQQPPVGQTMPFWSPDGASGSLGRNALPSASGNLSSIDQLTQSFTTQASLPRHPSHSSLHQHMAGSKPITVQLGVPDTRVGSILGRGGKTLTEIQAVSHTKIRISQRGEFIPGTQNRVVTITGSTTQDVEHAQNLVNQRLAGSFPRPGSSSEMRPLKDR